MVQHFLPGLGYPGSEEQPLGTATEVGQLLQLVLGRCPDTQESQQPFSKPQKEAFRLLSMSQEQASSLGSKRLSICKQEQDYPTLPFGDFPHHHPHQPPPQEKSFNGALCWHLPGRKGMAGRPKQSSTALESIFSPVPPLPFSISPSAPASLFLLILVLESTLRKVFLLA